MTRGKCDGVRSHVQQQARCLEHDNQNQNSWKLWIGKPGESDLGWFMEEEMDLIPFGNVQQHTDAVVK